MAVNKMKKSITLMMMMILVLKNFVVAVRWIAEKDVAILNALTDVWTRNAVVVLRAPLRAQND
ncbi:transmembrane protein, putative [Medicago truncatula]|uniref:Transmembrane protein, putative n=1 Tax=Medicago truncatula TaxID=3880 RepID=G7I7J5_MEDTR|nr:transmembrane protein, putative [Medicago truncatula]